MDRRAHIKKMIVIFRVFSNWLKRNPWIKTILTLILIIVPLIFLSRSLSSNWQALKAVELQLDWRRMAVALMILFAGFALYPLVTLIGLRAMGSKLSYIDAYYAYHSSQLGKYLPGRVWIIPGRAVVLKPLGVDPVLGGASALLESYLLVVAGIIVFIPYLFFAEHSQMSQLGVLGLILAVPAVLVIFMPRFLNKLFSLGMMWMGRAAEEISFSSRHLILMLGVDIIIWVISGFGLYYLVGSFVPLVFSQLPLFIGVIGFSWVVGFVSFLTPAGFGVREGAMGFLLAGLIPAPLPALMAIVARFWWSLADFGSIGIAFLLMKGRNRSKPTEESLT